LQGRRPLFALGLDIDLCQGVVVLGGLSRGLKVRGEDLADLLEVTLLGAPVCGITLEANHIAVLACGVMHGVEREHQDELRLVLAIVRDFDEKLIRLANRRGHGAHRSALGAAPLKETTVASDEVALRVARELYAGSVDVCDREARGLHIRDYDCHVKLIG